MRMKAFSSNHSEYDSGGRLEQLHLMNQAPRFTLLMANYNKGAYIDEAIRSVLNQTFTAWELIIIDDASTDDSLERIEKYLGDPRISLYSSTRNKGYTRTLIYGLTKVRSAIIGILDSDDALAPE